MKANADHAADALHRHRRDQISALAAQVIADEGLEAATVRRIAAEAGFSTTIVTHYFANKQDLLLSAFSHCAMQNKARIDAVVARAPADVVGCLLTAIPLDDDRRRLWRVTIALLESAKFNPAHAEQMRGWNVRSLEFLGQVILRRCGREDLNVAQAAETLSAVAEGIALQMLLHPATWPEAKARLMLTRSVEFVLSDELLHRHRSEGRAAGLTTSREL
jgi:AcrR family transcriptional regulator